MWQPPEGIVRASDAFVAIAKKAGDGVIKDIQKIHGFLRELMDATDGLFIVDFIDMANWDYVRDITVDEGSRIIRMIWKDYEGRRPDDMSWGAFPAERYGFAMRIQEVAIMSSGGVAIVLLRGFTSQDRDLAGAITSTSADEYIVEKETLFTRTVYKRTDQTWEIWNTHVAAAYSVALVPKARGIAWYDSHRMLYLTNLGRAENDISAVLQMIRRPAVDDSTATDQANVIRRAMEWCLKVECVFRELQLPKEYPELRLGELIAALKKTRSESERQRLNTLVRVLNEHSHDTGYPLDRGALVKVAESAILYIQELAQEIARRLALGTLEDFLPRNLSLTSWLETHDLSELACDAPDEAEKQ
jgi:hypothetical protein